MENIFILAERVLYQTDIEEKIQITNIAHAALKSNSLFLKDNSAVKDIALVSFPDRPDLLPPQQVRRRSLYTTQGRAAFFHALAHIELVAIYLAWDIIYRFRDLPAAFYCDWLQVAAEEVLHFQLLCQHLKQFGVDYGDLPAHRGLWDHAVDTKDNLLARLAIVPRCMEARGLDVTPAMIEKFKGLNDLNSMVLLSRILKDEVGHVKIGSYWFKFFCLQQQKDYRQTYRDLLDQFFIAKPKGPFNREMRIIAGFAPDEIDWLEQHA